MDLENRTMPDIHKRLVRSSSQRWRYSAKARNAIVLPCIHVLGLPPRDIKPSVHEKNR